MLRLIYPNDIASPQGYCLGDNRTRVPSQGAYEEAALTVFTMLDELEERLARSRYLFGDRPVETDWRLFTTLVRFDAVYAGHFKCNLRRLVDYPNLGRYARDLFQLRNTAAAVTSNTFATITPVIRRLTPPAWFQSGRTWIFVLVWASDRAHFQLKTLSRTRS